MSRVAPARSANQQSFTQSGSKLESHPKTKGLQRAASGADLPIKETDVSKENASRVQPLSLSTPRSTCKKGIDNQASSLSAGTRGGRPGKPNLDLPRKGSVVLGDRSENVSVDDGDDCLIPRKRTSSSAGISTPAKTRDSKEDKASTSTATDTLPAHSGNVKRKLIKVALDQSTQDTSNRSMQSADLKAQPSASPSSSSTPSFNRTLDSVALPPRSSRAALLGRPATASTVSSTSTGGSSTSQQSSSLRGISTLRGTPSTARKQVASSVQATGNCAGGCTPTIKQGLSSSHDKTMNITGLKRTIINPKANGSGGAKSNSIKSVPTSSASSEATEANSREISASSSFPDQLYEFACPQYVDLSILTMTSSHKPVAEPTKSSLSTATKPQSSCSGSVLSTSTKSQNTKYSTPRAFETPKDKLSIGRKPSTLSVSSRSSVAVPSAPTPRTQTPRRRPLISPSRVWMFDAEEHDYDPTWFDRHHPDHESRFTQQKPVPRLSPNTLRQILAENGETEVEQDGEKTGWVVGEGSEDRGANDIDSESDFEIIVKGGDEANTDSVTSQTNHDIEAPTSSGLGIGRDNKGWRLMDLGYDGSVPRTMSTSSGTSEGYQSVVDEHGGNIYQKKGDVTTLMNDVDYHGGAEWKWRMRGKGRILKDIVIRSVAVSAFPTSNQACSTQDGVDHDHTSSGNGRINHDEGMKVGGNVDGETSSITSGSVPHGQNNTEIGNRDATSIGCAFEGDKSMAGGESVQAEENHDLSKFFTPLTKRGIGLMHEKTDISTMTTMSYGSGDGDTEVSGGQEDGLKDTRAEEVAIGQDDEGYTFLTPLNTTTMSVARRIDLDEVTEKVDDDIGEEVFEAKEKANEFGKQVEGTEALHEKKDEDLCDMKVDDREEGDVRGEEDPLGQAPSNTSTLKETCEEGKEGEGTLEMMQHKPITRKLVVVKKTKTDEHDTQGTITSLNKVKEIMARGRRDGALKKPAVSVATPVTTTKRLGTTSTKMAQGKSIDGQSKKNAVDAGYVATTGVAETESCTDEVASPTWTKAMGMASFSIVVTTNNGVTKRGFVDAP